MKPFRAFMVALITVGAAALLTAQTTSTKPSAPAAPATGKTAEKDKDKAKAEAAKKKPEEPKIPGQVIARANGTFISLTLAGGNFRMAFYDAKKKPMKPDAIRANARWPNPRAPGDNRTVLNPGGDGVSLVGSKPVLPPFTFNVYFTLILGEGENPPTETLVVAFRG